MKVCLINNLYKPFNKGGAERIIEIAAKQFKECGHEVFVVATSPSIKKNFEQKYYEIFYEDNIKVYFIKTFYYNLNKVPIFFRIFWHCWDMFDFLTVKKIKKIINHENPDLVITNNLKGISFLLPNEICKLKIRHIHVLHDMQLLYPSGILLYGHEARMENFFIKFYRFICSRLFRNIKIIISPSRWLMREHEKRNFFKTSQKEIFCPPAAEDIFYKEARDLNLKNKKFIFLYIGQIEKHKGILFLINCFNKLRKENIELHIVGDGTLLKNAKNLANNKTIFYGQVKSDEIKNIILKGNCLIVPSLCYENSPTVIYEAIAAGLPIIASRIGGITELIDNFSELLFEPGNEHELTVKMNLILTDYPKIKKRYLEEYQLVKKNNELKYAEKIIKIIS